MRSESLPCKCVVFGVVVVSVAVLCAASVARGEYITVIAGPSYDPSTSTGYTSGRMSITPGSCVNSTGTAVGAASKYVSGSNRGQRAVRWGPAAAPAELDYLAVLVSGTTQSRAYAVNDAGAAVGYAQTYSGSTDLGRRAVRWDGASSAVTELDHLGTSGAGYTVAEAYALNQTGTAVGFARKYDGGVELGLSAVRWDAGSTTATELDGLGGYEAYAYDINDTGTAVGSDRLRVSGNDRGNRAVRWAAGATAATILGNVGTDPSGYTNTYAYAINASGTTVGMGEQYDEFGYYVGFRAVRWDGDHTIGTGLDHLGTDGGGYTAAVAYAVNDAGTAVGYANKYEGYTIKGIRAVRWAGDGRIAEELGHLGTASNGSTNAKAQDVSSDGTAVGYANKYESGIYQGYRAVMWGADGVAVDLNTLIDPASGWTLTSAFAISDDGLWIAGEGEFDPDGAGTQAAYDRLWVLELPASSPPADADGDGVVDAADYIALKSHYGQTENATKADGDFDSDGDVDAADVQVLIAAFNSAGATLTPEPATLGLLAAGGLAMLRRRRRVR